MIRRDAPDNSVFECSDALSSASRITRAERSFLPRVVSRTCRHRSIFYELFAIRIGDYLKSRAQADSGGVKWIQAENRIEPDNLQAQTGLMQGAAGIGLYFIHLAELDESAETANRFPDSPW